MQKPAPAAYALHPLIAARWSPRAFSERPVSSHALRTVLEAARWAPSCFNEQPWRIVIASRDLADAHARALACLTEKNQSWARRAWVLGVATARTHFVANGKPNRHAAHDLGMALAQMQLQATALELGVHFMAGFDVDAARSAFGISAEDDVLCMFAIGHRDLPDVLPEPHREKELAPRKRHPQRAWVYAGAYGQTWTPPEEADIEAVLAFWFGEVGEDGHADAEHAQRWWSKDAQLDEEIRTRFAPLYAAVRAGQHDDWLSSARGRLATILLLDQFTRNMFRDTPRMYEADARALEIALSGIDLRFDRALPGDLRAFFYLPLMHAESRAAQEACVRLFREFATELPGPEGERIRNNLRYAELHRDVVERFGRFPHRNPLLGRATTPEEQRFLDDGGPTF